MAVSSGIEEMRKVQKVDQIVNSSLPALDMVKNNAYELLCQKVEQRNEIRDFYVWILSRIMKAYSHIRCDLGSEYVAVQLEDVQCVNHHLGCDRQPYDYEIYLPYECDANRYKQNGVMNRSNYFFASVCEDYSKRFGVTSDSSSSYADKITSYEYFGQLIKKSQPLGKVSLEEYLWDPEKKRFDPDKLKEYKSKYNWAIPPNVEELIEEMTASSEYKALFEGSKGGHE